MNGVPPYWGEALGVLAWVAICVSWYVIKELFNQYKAYKRRIDNPLLKMAETDCKRRHK